jgi:hypothetical protein
LAAAAAFAAAPKPDISIKNKTVNAGALLDDKIKADPTLSADWGRGPGATMTARDDRS